MASLLYHHQLSRVHFLCLSPYAHCPSVLHVRRISCSLPAQSAIRAPLEACGRDGFGGSSSPSSPLSFHGAYTRRRVLCKFEEDDKKALSSSSSSSSECCCEIKDAEDNERPPFDINIAVVLAGFAFEAYNTPSEEGRKQETDPFGCKTTFLSEHFLREVYDGKLWINLKNGYQFPGLDLWGTSDPYVVLRIGECVIRSKTVWATTAPVWNEQLEINVKNPSTQFLQVAAWDANLVTDDRRLGNSGVNLEHLSDGKKHEVRIELEGMAGGGVLTMEIEYKHFKDLDATREGWGIPLLSDFFQGGWDDVLKNTFGSDSLTVRNYLSSVLGSSEQESNSFEIETQKGSKDKDLQMSTKDNNKISAALLVSDATGKDEDSLFSSASEETSSPESKDNLDEKAPEVDVFRDLGGLISQTFGVSADNLSIPAFDKVSWDALDVIKKLGLESRDKADSHYVESGLALSPTKQTPPRVESVPVENSALPVEDVQKASLSLLKQTEETLKSWAVLASSLTGQTKSNEKRTNRTTALIKDTTPSASQDNDTLVLSSTSSEKLRSAEELEELRKMFGKAESAMEAWAVLASSLGHRSFVKSAFEKLCFLDNSKTDTQVALWRDSQHRRVVIAFRGTEQVKWKDLRTDLMLLPVSFNPERVGGEFKEEAMVHGGFLSAYDSVRNRLMSLVKASIGTSNENADNEQPWQVYVTGHSLGGALATLFALELSTSGLSRHGNIKVTMYNFGSPRVGNKKFADRYNKILKDSWRVVNHRDIIPTVPRLMGYCHVARPIYLTAGDLNDATVNMELIEDGYQGDVIGEATPDFLIEEFMKGEKHLIERLLQTEIAMIRSIRDGSALMQHMEDFYYISLLENVSPKFRILQAIDRRNSEKDHESP